MEGSSVACEGHGEDVPLSRNMTIKRTMPQRFTQTRALHCTMSVQLRFCQPDVIWQNTVTLENFVARTQRSLLLEFLFVSLH